MAFEVRINGDQLGVKMKKYLKHSLVTCDNYEHHQKHQNTHHHRDYIQAPASIPPPVIQRALVKPTGTSTTSHSLTYPYFLLHTSLHLSRSTQRISIHSNNYFFSFSTSCTALQLPGSNFTL